MLPKGSLLNRPIKKIIKNTKITFIVNQGDINNALVLTFAKIQNK